MVGRTSQYGGRIGDLARSTMRDRGEKFGASLSSRRGRPQKSKQHNQHRGGKVDVVVLNVQLPGQFNELHLDCPTGNESVLSPWVVLSQLWIVNGHHRGTQADFRAYIADGRIFPEYNVVPLKKAQPVC